MTTPDHCEPRDGERAWAAEQLGLASGVSSTNSAALARQLGGHNFMPPPDWQTLARVVVARRAPETMTIAEGLLTGRRDLLRQEVECFCTEFFQLEPAERRARDAQLTSKCARHPPLLARLNKLAGGFDVACGALTIEESPEVKVLGDLLCNLFVLRPQARAVARQTLLENVRTEPRKWADAARGLRSLHPDVALLDGPLVQLILDFKRKQREIARTARKRKRAAARASGRAIHPALSWSCILLVSICFAVALMSDTKTNFRRNRRYSRRAPAAIHANRLPSPTSALDGLLKSGAKSQPDSVFELDNQGRLRLRATPRPKPKPSSLPEANRRSVSGISRSPMNIDPLETDERRSTEKPRRPPAREDRPGDNLPATLLPSRETAE